MSAPALLILDGRTVRIEGLVLDLVRLLVERAADLGPCGSVELRYSPSDVELHCTRKVERRRRT